MSPVRGHGAILSPDIEGTPLAEYNPAFAENPEWADFNILPIFFVRAPLHRNQPG
jgi:multidrug efflux pump subunit AcrA (membrane-fusion protein)